MASNAAGGAGNAVAESSAASGPGVSPGGTSTSSCNREPVLCVSCGQFHDPNHAHLYDYNHSLDAELMCRLCQKPLVDPLDTKCGHTFCTPCLKNHLAVQALCPIDKQIINFLECQQASQIVRNLLDKLLVVCPNVDYCEEVLPRCELESHLLYRCRGAVTRCIKAHLGCTFRGPRTALQAHLWECPFRSDEDASLEAEMAQQVVAGPNKTAVVEGAVTEIEIPRGCFDLGLSFVGGCDTPLMCIVVQEVYIDGIVARDGRLRPGDQILEVNGEDLTQATHSQAKRALSQLNPTCKLTVYREKSEESLPVEKEERLRIVLSKRSGRNLGIKIVGKKNCAGLFILGLVSDGLAELDGRLQKDDRILEINAVDLRAGTQEEAAEVIRSAEDKVCFVVCRRTRPMTPDIIQSVPGQSSGGNGGCASVSSLANDTGIPMLDHEFARKMALSRGVLGGCGAGFREQVRYGPFAALLDYGGLPIYAAHLLSQIVTVSKSAGESLGMSVAGGVSSQRGDIPVYVTNLQPDGVLGRTKQIKKGDIVLFVNEVCLLGLSHEQAVRTLKQASLDSREVTVHILDGPETSSGAGNFMPSWVYWLQLPRLCMLPRLIEIERDANGSLGFSIVGGADSVLSGPPQPIIVKSVVPGGPAHRDGRLRCGDILVAANEYPLTEVAHSHAVQMLKLARGLIHLRVVSWPGTIV